MSPVTHTEISMTQEIHKYTCHMSSHRTQYVTLNTQIHISPVTYDTIIHKSCVMHKYSFVTNRHHCVTGNTQIHTSGVTHTF